MMIQWFPGHMAKTRKLITDNLKLVDVVVEMLDARLPQSSRNPLLNDLIGDKPRVLVLAKADLAEEEYNKAWTAFFRSKGLTAIPCDLKGASAKREAKGVTDGLRRQADAILARRQARGITSKVVRAMVTGIPNAGKSTLINLLAGKARAETGDRPGVTRGKQWIRLEQDLELLDMPGILWPNLEDRDGAARLAVTGAIGDNAYDQLELALWLTGWLRDHRPGRLNKRYGVPESGEEEAILEAIGRRRGFLRKGAEVELDKTAVMLLDELRGGRLGRITWDELPETEEPGG